MCVVHASRGLRHQCTIRSRGTQPKPSSVPGDCTTPCTCRPSRRVNILTLESYKATWSLWKLFNAAFLVAQKWCKQHAKGWADLCPNQKKKWLYFTSCSKIDSRANLAFEPSLLLKKNDTLQQLYFPGKRAMQIYSVHGDLVTVGSTIRIIFRLY